MRTIVWVAVLVGLALLAGLYAPALNGEPAAPRSAVPAAQPFGLEKREPWTTSKVKGSPEPPDPYTMVRSLPRLTFNEALELVPLPQRGWLIAERPGKLYAFATDPANNGKKLVLDVKHTVYGVVLHPKFQENGYLYLSEVPDGSKETPDGTRVVRYTVDRAKMTADAKSAKLIFTWPNGGHNGGCLRFGPDGMLYISTGDGSGIADGLQTGQDLVRRPREDSSASTWTRPRRGKAYAIPKDNPFVSTKGARGEI